MADLPYSILKINDIEVSVDAPITEALMSKFGGAINYLLDRQLRVLPFTTPGVTAWVVPDNVEHLFVFGSGGGGGGGGGGATTGNTASSYGGGTGGGGGGGAVPFWFSLPVTAGETLTMTVGAGGTAGLAGVLGANLGNGVSAGTNGGSGGITSIARGSTIIARMPGAGGGAGGVLQSGTPGPYPGLTPPTPDAYAGVLSMDYAPNYLVASPGGKGGDHRTANVAGTTFDGRPTQSAYASALGGYHGRNFTTDSGTGGGGGAGGCGFVAGGRGGRGASRQYAGGGPSFVSSVIRSGDVTVVSFNPTGTTYYNTAPFVPGDKVTFAGFTPSSFNGVWTVLTSGSGTFSVSNAGANESATVVGAIRQETPGFNGSYGSGGGGGGGGSGGYAGVYFAGTNGGVGGAGFMHVIYTAVP